MATELSDPDTVGTALTIQMALGFSVTVVGIFAIPLVEASSSYMKSGAMEACFSFAFFRAVSCGNTFSAKSE